MDLKELKKYSDLLPEITAIQLKNNFGLVSWRQKSIPSAGSLTFKTERLNTGHIEKINNFIIHNDGQVTIQTNKGFLKFSN